MLASTARCMRHSRINAAIVEITRQALTPSIVVAHLLATAPEIELALRLSTSDRGVKYLSPLRQSAVRMRRAANGRTYLMAP